MKKLIGIVFVGFYYITSVGMIPVNVSSTPESQHATKIDVKFEDDAINVRNNIVELLKLGQTVNEETFENFNKVAKYVMDLCPDEIKEDFLISITNHWIQSQTLLYKKPKILLKNNKFKMFRMLFQNLHTYYSNMTDKFYKKLDYKLKKYSYVSVSSVDSLNYILMEDNIEDFQEYIIQHPSFNFEGTSGEMICAITMGYGSIKIFKYLLLNDIDPSSYSNYAITGGNKEIMHILEQKDCIFNQDSLLQAIDNLFLITKNPILNWLLLHMDSESKKIDDEAIDDYFPQINLIPLQYADNNAQYSDNSDDNEYNEFAKYLKDNITIDAPDSVYMDTGEFFWDLTFNEPFISKNKTIGNQEQNYIDKNAFFCIFISKSNQADAIHE